MRYRGCAILAATLVSLVSVRSLAQTSPAPPDMMATTFKACRWGRVDGRTLSIWSYACGKAAGDVRLVPADAVGGFALAPADAADPSRRIVIRTFTKPGAAPISAALPAILRATGVHRRSCRLVEHRDYGNWGTVWLLEPAGSPKRTDAADQPPRNPCGDLANGMVGDRFFRPLPGDPSIIVYADMGSEIQVFDPDTLTRRR